MPSRSWAEERLALALEASGIAGAWDWDAETNLIHGDARACALHGMDPALGRRGAPGPDLLVHVVPEDRAALDRALASALAGRTPLNIAYRTWPPGGDVTWVQLRGRVLRDDRGTATRLAGVALDISDQKDTEAALRESEARFRAIADTMPQAVWSTAPDGKADYFNRRWHEMTGIRPVESEGAGWLEAVHPEDRALARERWLRAVEVGDPYEVEYRLRTANGDWRWVLARGLPVRNARGRITRWFGTCTDIHDIRSAAEEREVLSHELSHRIKNIFSVITSLISLSARGFPEAAGFAADLRGRVNALARAHEFARPHSQASRPGHHDHTLLAFLREVLASYDPIADEEPRISIAGEDRRFDDSAATPLALLFHELATNAAKYGALSVPDGRVAIRVEVEGEELLLRWREWDGPAVAGPPAHEGFGTRLATVSVQGQLGGRITRHWRPEGLELEARLPAGALDRRRGPRQ
ncbi:PAS domain-containing protein [Pararoseomonas sp. SCSIO 73927]|uniref:sensor histidine kinase n=1 Tax=Pararoseomonas sp. SCSIO 73927 TaxID=3114537 RepID=UPI0030CF8805